jgi:hypothetical protein
MPVNEILDWLFGILLCGVEEQFLSGRFVVAQMARVLQFGLQHIGTQWHILPDA